MKNHLFIILILTIVGCRYDNLDDKISSLPPELEKGIAPPSWAQGHWFSQEDSISINFTSNNILIIAGNKTTNFSKDLPKAYEDFKTNSFYQLSLLVNGERQAYVFAMINPNTMEYTHKIMGYGPTFILSKK